MRVPRHIVGKPSLTPRTERNTNEHISMRYVIQNNVSFGLYDLSCPKARAAVLNLLWRNLPPRFVQSR